MTEISTADEAFGFELGFDFFEAEKSSEKPPMDGGGCILRE